MNLYPKVLGSPNNYPKKSNNVFNGFSSIVALGRVLGEKKVKLAETLEAEINEKLGLNGLFSISKQTGIETVYHTEHDTIILALSAVKELLENGIFGVDIADIEQKKKFLSDVDEIIFCAVGKDYEEPSSATFIQYYLQEMGYLNNDRVSSFDATNACLGFVEGLRLADALIASGKAEKILVVTAENASRVSTLSKQAILDHNKDVRDYGAALTLGDGAAAAVVTRIGTHDRELVLKKGLKETFAKHCHDCIIQDTSKPMVTNTKKLFNAAKEHVVDVMGRLIQELAWEIKDVDIFIPHQPSHKLIDEVRIMLGAAAEQFAITVNKYGNMASASVPVTLTEIVREKNPGRIILLGSGSGLSFGLMAYEYVSKK